LNFTFDTKHGAFDCLGEPSGRFDYEQLKRNAEELDIFGMTIHVASLDDLIRMKRAAGRAKDLIEVENLAALRDVREGRSE
jgi:predicted nucleotidyltransferase